MTLAPWTPILRGAANKESVPVNAKARVDIDWFPFYHRCR